MVLTTPARRLVRPLKRRVARWRRDRSLGPLAEYVQHSESIAGWARGAEAEELARRALALPTGAVIVEIGSFLGSSAVLLAGARKVSESGVVHCVDPFDGSGDSHSVPVYQELAANLSQSLRRQFDENMRAAGVTEWVVVHQGTSESIGVDWTTPVDLLFLDGDQSPKGARSAFDTWLPHLRSGGTLAVHNSADRKYSPNHDGYRRVVVESVTPPRFVDVTCTGTTTFAVRAS